MDKQSKALQEPPSLFKLALNQKQTQHLQLIDMLGLLDRVSRVLDPDMDLQVQWCITESKIILTEGELISVNEAKKRVNKLIDGIKPEKIMTH